MPATTAPQPRPLPEGQGHITRQGGQKLVVVWWAIMILLFTRRVPPCQPYFRVVDKDWARPLVTSHAAYPFAPPAPPSPPVAWGEPEAYAKVTSRTQHLESIADADPPGPASCFSGRSSSGASVRPTIRSDNDVPTIRFLAAPAFRPAEGPHGARRADTAGRRRHPHSPQRPRLPSRRVPAGHRSQNSQAAERGGDARPRQPRLGLCRGRLGGRARGERGRAARHGARPRAGGRGGAQDVARGRPPAAASPGGGVGIRAAGATLGRAALSLRRVRALVRGDRGVPAGRRRRHCRQYRHRRHARGERPRGRGGADALLHTLVCEPRGARGPGAQAPHRGSGDVARIRARGPAPRDARGQRLGGVPGSGGRGAAVDAASHGGAAVRQRGLRREGRRAARRTPPGDPGGEGGRRHRSGRVHLLPDRPMTAATTTLPGPVSRIDPASAYRRPASGPGLPRLDSNEGVLPSPALLGDLGNADPELLRCYTDVSALETALATRVGVAPQPF